jgi:hypothetical protein
MKELARRAGHDLDMRFAEAGLAAGPGATRAASLLLVRVLAKTPPNEEIKKAVNVWQRICRDSYYSKGMSMPYVGEAYQCLYF